MIDGVYSAASGRDDAKLLAAAKVEDLSEKDLAKRIAQLEKQMLEHARNLEFEQAARVRDQLGALRDAVSGVSLDEEAVTMLKFQRAYEANARFFRAIDETLGTLLDLVKR